MTPSETRELAKINSVDETVMARMVERINVIGAHDLLADLDCGNFACVQSHIEYMEMRA